MKRSVALTLAAVLFSLAISISAGAVDPPHYDPANGYTCASCHTGQLTLGSTGYNNVCLTCHRPGDPKAGGKPFTLADAADPFSTYTSTGISQRYQTSHRWDGSDTVPRAGAQKPLQPQMTTSNLRARTGSQLACVRCHNQHIKAFDANNPGGFLRMANDQDQMCLDCHRARNVSSHMRGSHPVSIAYDGSRPGFRPITSNRINPTANLNNYLKGGKVVCTTCHAVHYGDSHSSTVDGAANFTNLSSGDGFILRTDPRGARVAGSQPDRLNICTNCHANKQNHNFRGQDVQCLDCHGAHVEHDPNDPNNSLGTNVYLIRRNITRNGQSSAIYFRYTGSQREYRNAQGKGVCEGCHAVPAPGGNYPPEHASNDAKVCNLCHFHSSSIGSFSGACIACHGFPPTTTGIGTRDGLATPATNALGAAPAGPGAHDSHVNTRKMGCNTCHNGYAAKPMPSKTIDMGFAINAGNIPGFGGSATGGTYVNTNALTPAYSLAGAFATSGVNQSCTAVYCHGSTLTGGTNTAPAWTGTGQATCGSCHGVTAAKAPATGSHGRHAGSSATSLAMACDRCHGTRPDNSHVNGSVEWDLTGISPSAQYKTPSGPFATAGATANLAPSATFGQCSNVYCHSTVQGAGGSGAPTSYAQPTWGGAALGCAGCHADMKTGASATGSHVKHTQTCNLCHGNGYSATTAIYPRHANGFINMTAGGFAYSKGKAFTPGSAYGACANIACHGPSPNSAIWGSALNCQDCHSGPADNDVFPSPLIFTTASPVAAINTTQWTTAGHGRPAANGSYASGNPAADFVGAGQCLYCHDAAVAHNVGANPFRLIMANYSTASFGRNAPCLICHGTGAAGVAGKTASSKVSSTHHGAKHGLSNNGGYFCWDCHDPHGDGNSFMIQAQVAKTSDRATGAPTTRVSVSFTAFATGSDFAGTPTSICNACHTTTSHYSSGNVNDGHNAGTRCTDCHSHNNGNRNYAFQQIGVGCNSCHGYPPASAGFKPTQGNWSSARLQNYSGGGGAHTIQKHVNRLARPSEGFANCVNCHDPNDHDMGATTYVPKVRVNQRLRYEPAKLATYSSNRKNAGLHITGTCSNLSCHFGVTPKWDPKR